MNLELRGDDIVDSIERDGVYEVPNSSLMLTDRKLLKIKGNKLPIFAEPSIVFLAYVIDSRI